MWFWVYCESPLAELECHVLWWDGNRLEACSSLFSWINKGKIQLWTASLSDWDCHGDLIGAVTLLLLYIGSIYAYTSISALSSEQMSHNRSGYARKLCIGGNEERGKVAVLKESSSKVTLYLNREAVPRDVGNRVLSYINLGIHNWERLFLKSPLLQGETIASSIL